MHLPASVLGQGLVLVVNDSGHGVEDDVLEHGAESDCAEDVGLLLLGEADALGVALENVATSARKRCAP